ncbi:hypothetical protein DFH27DRAFT_609674 [Peziza echinospora]|nr:hypothetical protein DFH27DRAFT_609674 [Peziza echinospora]
MAYGWGGGEVVLAKVTEDIYNGNGGTKDVDSDDHGIEGITILQISSLKFNPKAAVYVPTPVIGVRHSPPGTNVVKEMYHTVIGILQKGLVCGASEKLEGNGKGLRGCSRGKEPKDTFYQAWCINIIALELDNLHHFEEGVGEFKRSRSNVSVFFTTLKKRQTYEETSAHWYLGHPRGPFNLQHTQVLPMTRLTRSLTDGEEKHLPREIGYTQSKKFSEDRKRAVNAVWDIPDDFLMFIAQYLLARYLARGMGELNMAQTLQYLMTLYTPPVADKAEGGSQEMQDGNGGSNDVGGDVGSD